jgi:Zn-dependent protease with chaperone function
VVYAPGVRPDRIEPLWDRVDRNRIELAVFVACFLTAAAVGSAVVLALVLAALVVFTRDPLLWEWILAHALTAFALVCAAGVGLAGAYVAAALSRSEKWLLRRFDAAIVPMGELMPTKFALKDMAIAAGFEVAPALWVIETRNVNAFVFGKGRRRPVVGITRGLAERLSVDEQRAVFANLMARLRAGDTIWATGVTAIMAPLWDVRDSGIRADEDPAAGPGRPVTIATERGPMTVAPDTAMVRAVPLIAWLFPVMVVFVVVSEIIAFGHRRSQLRHAEVADAEGMLLLKDPHAMLSALEKCVRFNNYVPTAGPGYTQLFYCWTGESSTDDEHDPENRRIARLREVLGVEGMAPPVVAPNEPVLPPPAPRLEQ